MRSTASPYVGKGKLRAFVNNTVKKAKKLLNLHRNHLKNTDRAANRTVSFKKSPTQTEAGKQSQVRQTQVGI